MPRQARKLSNSGMHHVMLRGINKQDIFHDDNDRLKMLKVFEICISDSNNYLHAYCLMRNHLHLLVQITHEPDSETLSDMMKRIGIRYVKYYNTKYARIGSLFQDRFRSEAVETDTYFLTVLRYIHRNPVNAGFTNTPDMYKWSSYNAYNTNHSGFVYTALGKKILGSRYKEYMNKSDSVKCLDIDTLGTHPTDFELSSIIEEMLHVPSQSIATFGRTARDNALRKIIKIDRVTLRQVARVTGVSRSVICKVASEHGVSLRNEQKEPLRTVPSDLTR